MSGKEEFIFLYDLSESDFHRSLNENVEIISKHWDFLRDLKEKGILLFAGTTLDQTYEFIVVQTQDRETAARLFEDDSFQNLDGIKGQLYSFRTSLLVDTIIEGKLQDQDINVEQVYRDDTYLFMGTITGRPTFINDMTEEEGKIMGVHFQHLKRNFDKGKLILAGPILEEGMFGLSVFYANNLAEARDLVKNDPAVVNGILKPNVHPFRLLLIGKK